MNIKTTFLAVTLLTTSPFISATDTDFDAITQVIVNNNIDELQHLITQGADVHFINYNGTVLMVAVLLNNLEAAGLLINAKANVNAQISNTFDRDLSVLVVSLLSKNIQMIDLLLNAGADINAQMHYQETKKTVLDIALELANNPNEIECLTEFQKSLHDRSIHTSISTTSFEEIIDYLTSRGAKTNAELEAEQSTTKPEVGIEIIG